MLAQIFKPGQAASTSASILSPPVVKAPSLPLRRSVNWALDQVSSAWLDSTSKCCSRRAMISGNTARATRILGLLMVVQGGVIVDATDSAEESTADVIGEVAA